MVTVTQATLPADEFVLAHTLSTLPAVGLEAAGIVRSGENRELPLLWVRGVDASEFEAACEADESTEGATLVEEFSEELLYRMEWAEQLDVLLGMLTNAEATILDAYAQDEEWHFRLLCPSRGKLSEIKSFCDDHEMTFDIQAIREMDGDHASQGALTAGQYEALTAAVESGYFEIPRQTDLEALAAELDVSHQALSERLRRGVKALVTDALQTGPRQQHIRASMEA